IVFDFGFRTTRDGVTALAVWAPDIFDKTGPENHPRWEAFAVLPDAFPEEFDPAFELWANRILAGSWDGEEGPLLRLCTTVREVNALTTEAVGRRLFKVEASSTLTFPSA